MKPDLKLSLHKNYICRTIFSVDPQTPSFIQTQHLFYMLHGKKAQYIKIP